MREVRVTRALLNHDLLKSQLEAALPSLFIAHGTSRGEVYVRLTDEATDADLITATNVVTNHNETELTTDQQRKVEQQILFEQVNARFIEEVIKATPDWDDCYDDIALMVTGQTAVTNALTNIIGLTNDVHLLTGIVGGSTRHKKQQILSFIQVLSLWSNAV